MLLKNGKIENDSLLAKSTLKHMHTPFSNRYGMGFSIGDWNGLHSIRHSELTKNYSSAINILPNQNYGIVILTNVNSFYAVRKLMDGVIIRLNKWRKLKFTFNYSKNKKTIFWLFVNTFVALSWLVIVPYFTIRFGLCVVSRCFYWRVERICEISYQFFSRKWNLISHF